MSQKNIIAFVGSVPPSATESIRRYTKHKKSKFRTLLIRDSRSKKKLEPKNVDILIECDLSKPNKIAEALLPYQESMLAITVRSESNVMKFAKVIPHVPYLRTPTTESLEWATDKLKMRRRMRLYDPKIVPKFKVVTANTKTERKRIALKVGFPLVVKPASLAESVLVSICYHEEELEKTLRNTFRKIKKLYSENNRTEIPTILAEEYMEGDMYSIDAYVNARGEVYCCPMVKVVTGKNIGHDDFYNYLRITPLRMKKTTIQKAEEATKAGIHALGLRNTTTHVELIKLDDEWKVIEIGPRIGGFRHKLHHLSCDIDHSLNDILIRMGKKPSIPKKCKGYAATLRYYPPKEGVITGMKGIKRIRALSSTKDMTIKLKIGDRSYFAKNGGKGIFDLTMFNKERSKLLADIRRVEQGVKITIK